MSVDNPKFGRLVAIGTNKGDGEVPTHVVKTDDGFEIEVPDQFNHDKAYAEAVAKGLGSKRLISLIWNPITGAFEEQK